VNRSQWAALAGVGLLLAGALVVRERAEQPSPAPTGADSRQEQRLVELREAAGLAPCPAGLGPQLPDLVLPCLGGGPDVDLTSAPPGRPTLVNVWATWCPPCVDEVPELVDLSTRAGDRLAVVGVLTEDTEGNGLEFARQMGVRYPSLVDEQGDLKRSLSRAVPVTLFLDAQGRVAHSKRGPFADRAEVDSLVRQHLGLDLTSDPTDPTTDLTTDRSAAAEPVS
jgi:thiol-disulfide isomerase/thioredoxin